LRGKGGETNNKGRKKGRREISKLPRKREKKGKARELARGGGKKMTGKEEAATGWGKPPRKKGGGEEREIPPPGKGGKNVGRGEGAQST